MRVGIEDERCVGHGMCQLACPKVFALSDEDGRAYVLAADVAPEFAEAVLQAERGCPEQAVRITL